MLDGVSARASLGLDPIPGEAPAGVNARYEPEYEELQAEISKFDSGGPRAVDAAKVVRLAQAVLEQKSKDLLVGAFFAYGLVRTDSYAGLADGLAVLRDMMQRWWDDLQPPKRREAARAAALGWLAQRVAPLLDELALNAAVAPSAVLCGKRIEELQAVAREKFETAMPEIGDFARSLKGKAAEAEALIAPAPPPVAAAPVPTPAATPTPVASAPAAAPPVPAPIAAATPLAAAAAPSLTTGASPAQIDRAIDQTGIALRNLANAVREADPADPRAIELMRAAVWLPIKAPPASRDGVTPLNPPSAERLQRCQEWLEAGRHVELLYDIEKSLDNFPFWFEGQRLAALALERAGEGFKPSLAALKGALANFLGRLPALLELRYANGTGFVDDGLRGWIDAELRSGGGGGQDEPWAAALRLAGDTLAQGRAKEAVAAFGAVRPRDRVGRDGFLWDLALARLCLQADFVTSALDIADQLDRRAREAKLDDWEPRTCAEVCALILQCYRALPNATGVGGRDRMGHIAAVRARLSWLDVGQALQFIDVT